MSNRYYALGPNDLPIPLPDSNAWARSLDPFDRSRRVGCERAAPGVWVETGFFGSDRGDPADPPRVWETGVLAGFDHRGLIRHCWAHCATREEAVAQHEAVLAEVRAHLDSCPGGCVPPWEEPAEPAEPKQAALL